MKQNEGQTAVLFELDNASWETLIARAEKWFLNVQMIQTSFRKLVEDTVPKINDSNVRLYLETLLEIATRHETQAADLLRMIGREPSTTRKVADTGLAKTRELWAGVIGLAGGAVAAWMDLQQILHASLDGIAAFGVANHIGLTLGLSDVTELTLHITNENLSSITGCKNLFWNWPPYRFCTAQKSRPVIWGAAGQLLRKEAASAERSCSSQTFRDFR